MISAVLSSEEPSWLGFDKGDVFATNVSSSCRLGSCAPIRRECDFFLSNRSAPSWYPTELSIWRDSIDFFRRRLTFPPSTLNELDGLDGGPAKAESSPDLLLICSALLSRNVLNSLGASSGCNRAGTQNNLDASSSLADGALGMPAALS